MIQEYPTYKRLLGLAVGAALIGLWIADSNHSTPETTPISTSETADNGFSTKLSVECQHQLSAKDLSPHCSDEANRWSADLKRNLADPKWRQNLIDKAAKNDWNVGSVEDQDHQTSTAGHDFAMGVAGSISYNIHCGKVPNLDRLLGSPVFMAAVHASATDEEMREAASEVSKTYASSPELFCEIMKPIYSKGFKIENIGTPAPTTQYHPTVPSPSTPHVEEQHSAHYDPDGDRLRNLPPSPLAPHPDGGPEEDPLQNWLGARK